MKIIVLAFTAFLFVLNFSFFEKEKDSTDYFSCYVENNYVETFCLEDPKKNEYDTNTYFVFLKLKNSNNCDLVKTRSEDFYEKKIMYDHLQAWYETCKLYTETEKIGFEPYKESNSTNLLYVWKNIDYDLLPKDIVLVLPKESV